MAQSELLCIYHSNVRGYHVYKDIWFATNRDILICRKEASNIHDPYRVAVVDQCQVTVGHVPREISAVCSLFCWTIKELFHVK